MLEDYKSFDKRGYAKNKYQLPQSGIVQYPKADLPIDPYVIGCFLGDGCCLDQYLAISSNDKELIEDLEKRIGHKAKKRSSHNYSWDWTFISPKVFFKEVPELLNYSYNKSIPKEYMFSSKEQRLELLAGLFDTDGSPRRQRNGIQFGSTSLKLCQQVRQLVLGLGCHCGTIMEDHRKNKYTKSYHYMTIQGPKELLRQMFHLKRKVDIMDSSPEPHSTFKSVTICKIEKVEDCEMRCILVDNPEHLFLTEDFIVTHNTSTLCTFICELLEEGYRVCVATMTGKATGVIRQKVMEAIHESGIEFPKENLQINTIQKITKKSSVLGITEDGETKYTNEWINPKLFGEQFDVLFIDELSMVPAFVSEWWRMSGVRVFGFGDGCQLPEVSTGETKRELDSFRTDLKIPKTNYVSGYGVKVLQRNAQKELKTILRSDNEIAHLCNDLRDFNAPKSQIVKKMKEWAEKAPDAVQYSTKFEDIETGDDWQIISYMNKTCQSINRQLAIGKDYPSLADKILLLDNINPLRKYNGETMKFSDLLAQIKIYNAKHPKAMLYVCLKYQNKMPRKDSSNEIERNFFNTYVTFKRAFEQTNMQRLQDLPKIMRESGWSANQIEEWIKEVQEIKKNYSNPADAFIAIVQKFQDVDRLFAQHLMDKSVALPRLYMINFDLGYAITCHKSQGSEYENVCYLLERFDRPLLYTGVSRAKKKVKIINLTNER